jgi:hypothetical protein
MGNNAEFRRKRREIDRLMRDASAEAAGNRPKPRGHFTGRCKRCGSSNLWDDNLAYGCNSCGAILATN